MWLASAYVYGQGNPCPPPPNASVAARSCGAYLCFSGAFGDAGVLQRAPARAAYYGATGSPPRPGAAVLLTLVGALEDGSPYNQSFGTTAGADGTWKVLLNPMPTGGDFTATAMSGAGVASLRNQTFGEVWVFAGQSNMGTGSPLRNNFARNATYAALAGGRYARVALWQSPDDGGVPWPREELGNWVTGSFSGFTRLTLATPLGSLDGLASMPLLTAIALVDVMLEQAAPPPPLGIYAIAVGGTNLEAWAPYASALGCINATCMCADNWVQSCDVYTPLANRSYCGCNGMLHARQIQPLANVTIGGLAWWQGENACMFTGGSSLDGTGYGCVLPRMIAAWRALWSVVPGTTSASFPVGVVLLADGTDGGYPGNLGNINRALTANFGALPNAALPNSFLASAFDVGDPWMDVNNPQRCAELQCCVEPDVPLGPLCVGDHRGKWSNATPNNAAEHPRTKDVIARRLAQALWATVYAPPGTPLLASGPVLAGCDLAADGRSLTLTFDAAALKGEALQVAGPPGGGGRPFAAAADNTALYVLVNATLPPDAGAGAPITSDNRVYVGPYSWGFAWPDYGARAAGNEFGVAGWVAVLPAPGPGLNQITVDLTGVRGAVTAVRYATGGGSNGYFENNTDAGRVCCGPLVDTHREPCPPESCPLKATGRLALPALPFVANIVGGKCACLPPQRCDA
jgi:hypothetical protein